MGGAKACGKGLRRSGTRFDVSVKVVFPAALSGIMSSYLLAIARAVGEAMVVALAAGASGKMAWNPDRRCRPRRATSCRSTLVTPIPRVEYYSTYAIAATLFISPPDHLDRVLDLTTIQAGVRMIPDRDSPAACSRRLVNRSFLIFCIVVTSLSILSLGVLLVSITIQGLEHLDLDFVKNPASRKREGSVFASL